MIDKNNLKDTIIRKAIKIRAFENSLIELFNDGKLNGTIHTCVGQELTGAVIGSLINEDDFILSNHRGHGHYIGRFDQYEALLAEIMGKEIGCSGGFGGSQHLVGKNFLSNGVQGGMTPIGLGISFANKLNNNDSLVIVFIGDGTLGQGILYESMNFAAVLETSLLFIIENNGIAQSTPQKMTFRGDMRNRASGFGFDYFHTSTYNNSIDDFINTSSIALGNARQGKPSVLEIETFRLNAHSKGDDNRFISDLERARNSDFISDSMNNNTIYRNLYYSCLDEIKSASIKLENLKTLSTVKVLKERDDYKIENQLDAPMNLRYNQRLNKAFHDLMIQFENIIHLGEDIIDKSSFTEFDYGGAFKVTYGLSTKYPERVYNSPISEQCITGVSTGLGISGYTVILEIMFGDFTTLIVDQVLQHLTKFEIMFNGAVRPSVIIRTPMGGKRGYGPTHSQSIEKLFLGVPNLRVIALNKYADPYEIYKKLIIDKVPSIVIENKILYTEKVDFDLKELYKYSSIYNCSFPVITIIPQNSKSHPSVTILTYGQVISDVEKATEYFYFEEEIVFDIYCFTRLDSIDCPDIFESVSKTKKVLVIEEGNGFASWGSEIISYISAKSDDSIKFYRLNNNYVIPCSINAEMNLIPDKEMIIKKIKEIL